MPVLTDFRNGEMGLEALTEEGTIIEIRPELCIDNSSVTTGFVIGNSEEEALKKFDELARNPQRPAYYNEDEYREKINTYYFVGRNPEPGFNTSPAIRMPILQPDDKTKEIGKVAEVFIIPYVKFRHASHRSNNPCFDRKAFREAFMTGCPPRDWNQWEEHYKMER